MSTISSVMTKRLLDDEEFFAFTAEGTEMPWVLLIALAMEESPYGLSGFVGVHPKTGDIVALGLNVPDIKDTLKDCGYPDTEYVDDGLPDLFDRLDDAFEAIEEEENLIEEQPLIHEQTRLRIDDDVEFEVDKGIASLIYACWHNGAPTVMSCENIMEGRGWIQFNDPLCADDFLTGIFADGDIYWDGKKVDPADWKWKTRVDFFDGGPTTNIVNVYFPPVLIELLTEALTKPDRPERGEMISTVLPELKEEVQRLFSET